MILCWGEVLWDLFPDGRRLGGAPANVAYHLARLGRRVAMVTRLGDDDLGHEALAVMRAAGIDTRHVVLDPQCPTGRVEIEMSGPEARYTLVPGCAWERLEADLPAADLAEVEAIVYGTLSQIQAPVRASLDALLARLPPDALRVCDPNLRPRFVDAATCRWALERASVIKLGADEARLLDEAFGQTRAAPSVLDWLRGRDDVRALAITRGADGALLEADGARADHPGTPATPGGDNVGAGDSYTAVLTHGLLAGCEASTINDAATRYAALVASRRGATPALAPNEVRERVPF